MAFDELNEENLGSTKRTRQMRIVDVLEQAKNFHRRLGQFYGEKGKELADPKVRLLLDHMAAHERYLEECVKAYREDAPDAVLEQWFKYSHDVPIDELLKNVELTDDMSVEDVAEMVFKMEEKLLRVYEDLASKALSEKGREALENLFALEKQEEIRAMRSAIME